MVLENILVVVAVLLALSIFASKASGRLGVPALILFLVLGMLAGTSLYCRRPGDRLEIRAAEFALGAVSLDRRRPADDRDGRMVRASHRRPQPPAGHGPRSDRLGYGSRSGCVSIT